MSIKIPRNLDWFEKDKKHRNELTHNGALIMFPSSNNKWFFGTHRNDKGFIPNYEIKQYITDSHTGFINFLLYYNSHFAKRMIYV